MTITVNSELKKSRNPKEHGFRLEKQKGECIEVLDDGYNRISFDQFQIKVQFKLKKKVAWKFVPLEWYLHEDDFSINLLNKNQQ